MLDMYEASEILRAVLEVEPPKDMPPFDVLKKILADTLVCNRAQELMIEYFALAAIQRMAPIERQALRVRLRLANPPLAAAPRVEWGITRDQRDTWQLCAKRGDEKLLPGMAPLSEATEWYRERVPKELVRECIRRNEAERKQREADLVQRNQAGKGPKAGFVHVPGAVEFVD